MARRRQFGFRLIEGAHGNADHEAGGQQVLAPWEYGEPAYVTKAEHRILLALADDKTKVEIARATWRSPWTISQHVKALHRKSGTHTLAGLVAWAFRRGLIE